jgi:hypothetical protein
MAYLSGKSSLDTENLRKAYSRAGIAAIVCSCLAVLVLAFLIPFGLLQTCSLTRIALFIWLLSLSSLLGFSGIAAGIVGYKKYKDRLAFISLLVGVLYISLMLYLIQLMYS